MALRFRVGFLALGVFPAVSYVGCASEFSCDETRTCSSPAEGGTAGSDGGTGGTAGGASGSSSANGGTAGSAPGGKSGSANGGSGGRASSGRAGAESGGAGDDGDGDGHGGTRADAGEGGQKQAAEGGQSGEDYVGAAGSAGENATAPECGNGRVEGDEACDDGEDNGLYLDACAPDCSRIIVTKHIVASPGTPLAGGDLGSDPVATADSRCPSGYKAMFAYGTVRRAGTQPFDTTHSIDWPIQPYTYYVNTYENLVWITDEVALLGVRDGHFVGLVTAILQGTDCFVSNIAVDGTTLNANNCAGWSSANSPDRKQCGMPIFTTADYLDAANSTANCSTSYTNFYCVEQ